MHAYPINSFGKELLLLHMVFDSELLLVQLATANFSG
jgi:hypothetical protein